MIVRSGALDRVVAVGVTDQLPSAPRSGTVGRRRDSWSRAVAGRCRGTRPRPVRCRSRQTRHAIPPSACRALPADTLARVARRIPLRARVIHRTGSRCDSDFPAAGGYCRREPGGGHRTLVSTTTTRRPSGTCRWHRRSGRRLLSARRRRRTNPIHLSTTVRRTRRSAVGDLESVFDSGKFATDRYRFAVEMGREDHQGIGQVMAWRQRGRGRKPTRSRWARRTRGVEILLLRACLMASVARL